MKTFQKPLTAEEERYYLERCQAGDPEAKDILIERNMRLVAHVVKKYQGMDEDLDDLISIGTIGLIKAVSTFDTGKATRLSTYAARCIDNAILPPVRQISPASVFSADSITLSSNFTFWPGEQFRFRIYCITISAWTPAMRQASSRLPSSVSG